MRGIYLIFSILLILAACEPVIKAVPTSEYQNVQQKEQTDEPIQEINPCLYIKCDKKQVCENGLCVTDNEQDNEITKTCAFGEEWDGSECVCEEGRYWCGEQQRCIQNGDCCAHTQCKRYERCVPTQFRVRLCAELPSGKLCRLLTDNGRKELAVINNKDTKLGVANWYNDNSINFTLNDQSLLIFERKKQELAGTNFYFENFEEYGGFCKEDED